MGTSNQFPVSSETFKRSKSLLQEGPERVVDIADKWRKKAMVRDNALSTVNTRQRIYEPASNIERAPEDGCMKKIKIERSLKLRKEDVRERGFNVITNNDEPESVWLDSFNGP